MDQNLCLLCLLQYHDTVSYQAVVAVIRDYDTQNLLYHRSLSFSDSEDSYSLL